MGKAHATTATERESIAVVGLAVVETRPATGATGGRIKGAGYFRDGLAHGFVGHAARRRQVLLQERGRNTQRAGHVVETFYFYFTRQDLLGVYFHPHQFFDRGGEFGAVQSLDRHVARMFGGVGMRIDGVFKVGNQGVDRFLRGLVLPGGRHQATTQADNGFFPHLRVVTGLIEAEGVQIEAAGPIFAVMAFDAVSLQGFVQRRGCLLGLSLGHRGQQRQAEPRCARPGPLQRESRNCTRLAHTPPRCCCFAQPCNVIPQGGRRIK